MATQSQKLNGNKVKEYFALLKTKATQDLISLRDRLRAAFKAEKEKAKPDNSVLQNHNVQLSLIGRVLKEREPIDSQDKSEVVQDSTIGEIHEKPFEEKLKEKSLDELNVMVVNGKKKLEQLAAMAADKNVAPEKLVEINNNIEHFTGKLNSIQAEISTRSATDAAAAKSDLNTAQGKLLGMDSNYVYAGAAGAIIVGVIAHSSNKIGWSLAGYAALGFGLGTGLVWLNDGGLDTLKNMTNKK